MFTKKTPSRVSSQIPEYEYGNVVVVLDNVKSISEWAFYYNDQLIEMFLIMKNTVNKNMPNNNIDWDSDSVFNNFIRLIYHCSSKNVFKDT